MKSIYKKALATVGLLAISATVAEATPAFARQMNADCMTCHYQNIPKLNSFGREFKLSGFTMTGGTAEITSEQGAGTALPANMNFGFVTKARLLKHDNADMLTEIFDESAFIFGGKVAEGVGTSMEFGAGLLGGKFTFTKNTDIGRIGLTYFMTDALGAFSGTEVYSTGLYRPVRQFENRKGANIFQKLGIGAGQATGFQAYYNGNGLTATVGQYAPAFAASAETGTDYKTLVRASYEMSLSGYTVAFGGYSISGDVTQSPYAITHAGDSDVLNLNAIDQESTGLDLQVEGSVADMPLMLTAGYVLSNTHNTTDMTGFSAAAQINPMDVLGVKAAVMTTSDNTSAKKGQTSLSIGTDYMYAQNVRLCLEATSTSYEDSTSTNSELDLLFMSMIAF